MSHLSQLFHGLEGLWQWCQVGHLMAEDIANLQAWCHIRKGGCPNGGGFLQHAGFISVTCVQTRPLPVDYARRSCWASVCLWPKTHLEPMAEAVVGDVNHSMVKLGTQDAQQSCSGSDGGDQLLGGLSSAPSSVLLRHNGGIRKDRADGL